MTALTRRHALFLTAAAAMLPGAAFAQTDPAVATVQGFYDALLAQMKKGGSARSRYDMLKPAADKAFDFPGMTALVVGLGWTPLSDADKRLLTDAFSRMIIATYVGNFNAFHGEEFAVKPAALSRTPTEKRVDSTLKTDGKTYPFGYRVRQVGSDWKILDIYQNGTISELTTKRSEFAATFASGGAAGLAKVLNSQADKQLA